MDVGFSMRAARVRADLSIQDVADKFHKSRSWITNIESGWKNISLRDAQKVFEFYGMPDIPLNKIFLKQKVSKSAKQHTKGK